MIPQANITAWRATAPWADDAQVEQVTARRYGIDRGGVRLRTRSVNCRRESIMLVTRKATVLPVIFATCLCPLYAGGEKAGETAHFRYRLQPAGPCIDSQRGSMAFGFDKGTIYLSEDNARTWAHRLAFPDAGNITFSCIMKNGDVVFATGNRLYRGTGKLTACKEIIVKDANGADYKPHTPKNPKNPGWYYHAIDAIHPWDVDGREMLVWGNYCNVVGGATPVNIYYSTDGGKTVKIAYSFGRNPHFRDNGSGGGGRKGTLLGDAANPVIARHVHCVEYNPAEKAFYACTGDHDRGRKHECHWMKGRYDVAQDRWEWEILISTGSNTRYKSGGIHFVDGMLYWAADANGPKPHDRGLFRCDPADLTKPEKHTKIYDAQYESANMIIQDGVIMASYYPPASPYTLGIVFSPDMGKTWTVYDIKEFGKRSPVRYHRKNGEGWFRVDLRTGWVSRSGVLFIKPK